MSRILTKCKVISYSYCKFEKRLHPSFKRNFHAPLQTIRFLSSAFKKSSHPPFKKKVHPPIQTIKSYRVHSRKVLIPHSRRHCSPHCRFKKRLHPPFKKVTSPPCKGNEDSRHWPGTDSCISICTRMVKHNMMHMRIVYNMYMRWWLHIYIYIIYT